TPANVVSVPGDLVIGDGVGGADNDVVALTRNEQIADGASVTLNSSGLLTLGSIETVGSLSGTGHIDLQEDGSTGFLTTGANNHPTVFPGPISGLANSPLTKIGAGTQTRGGNNTCGGPPTTNGGVLSISSDATLGTAPATATPGQLVINGGTLQTTAT